MAVDSSQYRVTPRSITLRGDWLRAVWYCAEIDSAQYDTARRLTLRSMILHGDSEKFEYLSKNETIYKNILTYWSVAQAFSNAELGCPFNNKVFFQLLIWLYRRYISYVLCTSRNTREFKICRKVPYTVYNIHAINMNVTPLGMSVA